MQRVPIRITPTFPVGLVCYSDGKVSFSVIEPFSLIIDNKPDGVSGLFDMKGFTLKENDTPFHLDYPYDTPMNYKEMPVLKRWLVQQNLVAPVFTR